MHWLKIFPNDVLVMPTLHPFFRNLRTFICVILDFFQLI